MALISVLAALGSIISLAGVLYPFRPFKKRRNAIYSLVGCFVLVGITAPSPDAGNLPIESNTEARASGVQLRIPSDPQAKYLVTEIKNRTDGLLEVSTTREGKSGTSYSIRLVQCAPRRYGYIADAETKSALVRDPSPELAELVTGSISDFIVEHACTIETARQEAEAENIQILEEKQATKEKAEIARRNKIWAEIDEDIELLRWSQALVKFRRLSGSTKLDEQYLAEVEAKLLSLVKPLPSIEREANLAGYKLLSEIRPENVSYSTKVESYENAIRAQRERAISILRKDEDRIEGVTWYKHPNQPKYLNSRSTAYLYIGRKGSTGRPWLRMKVIYTASDWLFVRNVAAWHDGIKEPLVSGNFERDNNSDIWEWVDVSPDAYQLEVLRSLANAREAILRFEGDQYRKDVTLSSADKKAIKEVLLAYEIMNSGE